MFGSRPSSSSITVQCKTLHRRPTLTLLEVGLTMTQCQPHHSVEPNSAPKCVRGNQPSGCGRHMNSTVRNRSIEDRFIRQHTVSVSRVDFVMFDWVQWNGEPLLCLWNRFPTFFNPPLLNISTGSPTPHGPKALEAMPPHRLMISIPAASARHQRTRLASPPSFPFSIGSIGFRHRGSDTARCHCSSCTAH